MEKQEAGTKGGWRWRPRRWWIGVVLFWSVGVSGAWAIAGTRLFFYWPEGAPGTYISGPTGPFLYAGTGFVQLVVLAFIVLAALSDRGWRIPVRVVWLWGVWIAHLVCTTFPLDVTLGPMAYQPELGEFVLAATRPLLFESLVSLGVGFPIIVWAMRRSSFFVKPILAQEDGEYVKKPSFLRRSVKSGFERVLALLHRVAVTMKNRANLGIALAVASIGLSIFLYSHGRAREEGRLVVALPPGFEVYLGENLDLKHIRGEKYVRELPEGDYDLEIRRPGHLSFLGTVIIHAGEDLIVDVPFVRVTDTVFVYRDLSIHLYYVSLDYRRRELRVEDTTELLIDEEAEQQRLRRDNYFIYQPETVVLNGGLYAGKGVEGDNLPVTERLPGGCTSLDEWPDGTYRTVVSVPLETGQSFSSLDITMEKDHDLITFTPSMSIPVPTKFYWEGYTWKTAFLTFLRRYLVLLRYVETKTGLRVMTWDSVKLSWDISVRQFNLSELGAIEMDPNDRKPWKGSVELGGSRLMFGPR